MLASDLDGTLIFRGDISQKNKDALKRFKNNGGVFAISTGRAYADVEHILEKIEITPDFIILNNGALIIKGNDVLHKKYIDKNIILKVYNDIEDKINTISIQTKYEVYTIMSIWQRLKRKTKILLVKIIKDNKFTDNKIYLNTINEINKLNKEFTAISLTIKSNDIDKIQEIAEYINEKYGQYVSCYRNTIYLDIVPKGCSKGNAVEYIRTTTNLDINDVYTIGDSWNDNSMFEVTKNSFTFTYAEDELKNKTNYVVETVADCIDTYILNCN